MYVDKTAADTISGLHLTSSSYKQAIKLLTDLFASKQFIVSSYMNTLFKLSTTEVMDLTKLRYLFDQVESTIRSLQSVGITPESYESFVAPPPPPPLMSKLPNELRLDINTRLPVSETSEREWKLEQLLDAFRKELQLRVKCNFVPSSSDKGDKSSLLRQRCLQPPTAATLYTENQEKHDRVCVLLG